MWPDGICRVTDTRYTKTIQYQDINYQLSQNEDKTAIFEAWCDFLNYFDSSVQFQLSFVNLSASQETFARSISIPPCGDEFDGIRAEYAGMLQNQLARGNNGLIKTKYLTFGVEADNLRAAKPRLERIETDLLNNFKRLGVVAAPLNGFERLHVMHDILRMDEQEPFRFSWDWLPPSGLSTKDFIAPSSFEFKTGRMFRMGKKLGAISFVQILAPELNDRMLADFLDMESSVLVNLHVQSVDQVNAIKTVKRKITDLDKSKIEEQKKAVRAGYDMDIIPSDLATYGAEAKKLLQDLQSRNERMFLLTFLILNTADTPRQLDNNIFQTSSIAQKYNCALTRLDFQQEEGLMSSLPLGLNQVEIQRGLTTSSTAIFVPFTTQELFQNGKEAVGKRRALRELVQPIRKAVIKGIGIMMSHIAPRIMSCVKTPIPCSRKIDFGSRVLFGEFSVFPHQFWAVTRCCVLGRNIRICPLRRLLSQKRLARLRPRHVPPHAARFPHVPFPFCAIIVFLLIKKIFPRPVFPRPVLEYAADRRSLCRAIEQGVYRVCKMASRSGRPRRSVRVPGSCRRTAGRCFGSAGEP